MAATSLTDGLSVSFALINGFDSSNGDNDGHADLGYVLGAEFTVPDSLGFLGGSTLYAGYVDGSDEGNWVGVNDDGDDVYNAGDNTLLYIGASVNTPIEGLAIGVAYDDREWSDGVTDSDSVAVYASYSLSDDASIALRYDNGTINQGPVEDSFDNLALTLDYSLWENVTTRFELGWESGVGELGHGGLALVRPTSRASDGAPAGNSSYFAFNAFYSF
jgi:hypothetical protein